MFWCTPDPQFELTDDGPFYFLAFTIREEFRAFETELASWLASPEGRFAQYYAERERLLSS